MRKAQALICTVKIKKSSGIHQKVSATTEENIVFILQGNI